jgi:5'-nucleotidase
MPAAGSLAALAAAAALCGTGPLEILLTNDDGADAIGIRALRTQLAAAGHRVTLVAPDHNASGTAMSFSWNSVPVTRDPRDPAIFAVGATPATAVVLGATALYPSGQRPDLVISGINNGPNRGALLVLSGTVGAALAGTMLVDPPVPGMAVNAERLHPAEPPDAAANRAQIESVAAHVTRLLASARGWYCADGRVTRARSVLNVNYPARPVAQVRGVVVAEQGTTADLRVTFAADGENSFRARTASTSAADAPGSDQHWSQQGYVTVTPVSGAIGEDSAARHELERHLAPGPQSD